MQGARKGKYLRRNEEKQILQETRGVLQKHVKIVWLNDRNNCSEIFHKIARKVTVLKFPGKHAWWKPLLPRCAAWSLERY